jgi:hypothetical protein
LRLGSSLQSGKPFYRRTPRRFFYYSPANCHPEAAARRAKDPFASREQIAGCEIFLSKNAAPLLFINRQHLVILWPLLVRHRPHWWIR